MEKMTLQQNILPTADAQFIVEGLPDVIILKRGEINSEFGVIKLADQTQVAGGRQRAGSFDVEFQFADDKALKAYQEWHLFAQDQKGKGINPNYKKSAMVKFNRLFSGVGGQFGADSDLGPVLLKIVGCWISKMTFPAADVNADDGDGGDTICKAVIQYDAVARG
jgi:hypothetical protein